MNALSLLSRSMRLKTVHLKYDGEPYNEENTAILIDFKHNAFLHVCTQI